MKNHKRKPGPRATWAPGRKDKVSRSYRLFAAEQRRAPRPSDGYTELQAIPLESHD